jgi:diguanylate cyclase (GGDEF)-like protein/PAS domain S-box-containing protein
MTVLVVDDVAINRAVLRESLEPAGYAVIEARDGVEALALLERTPASAVISDVLMPNMDGYRLCHEIRQSERWHSLPFIFYSSAYRKPSDEKLALEIGGDLFLRKPAEVPALLDALKQVTSERHSGKRPAPTLPAELDLMKRYSARLVDKLVDQNAELRRRTLELEREIAARQRVEDDLQHASAELKEAQRTAKIGSWTLDSATGAVTWSDEIYRIFGREPSSHAPNLDERILTPESDARIRAAIANTLQTGVSYQEEIELVRPDGERRWLLANGVIRRGAEGQLLGLQGTVQDITAGKRAEEKVRESERMLSNLMDNLPGMVYRCSGGPGGPPEFVSAGVLPLTGYRPEELVSPTPRIRPVEMTHPDDRERVRSEILRANAESRQYTLEYRLISASGEEKWVWERGRAVRGPDGEVIGIEGFISDITERKLQQERIGRLSRMRGVMSSINALIVRTRSRVELFQEASRIAVEQGGFGLAWIGVVQGGRELVPIATHGNDGGHVSRMKFTLEGSDDGACLPTVLAIRENQPRVCNDVANDPAIGSWREPLLALGYGSFAAYPLTAGKQAVGCFNLYAAAPGFFDEEEMKLLAELAGDISYALEFIIRDEQLDFLSIYDPLTRLPNRTLFMRRLPGFIQAAQDSSKRLALLMLDIERFKAINDAIGQAGGDELLKHVGERLKFHAGGPSFAARIAGDRFVALIPEIDRGAEVETLVQNGNWGRLDPPFQHGGQEFSVTFKIGLAVFPQDAADAEALLRNAELALKHGKSAGGQLTRYTSDMGDVALRKLQLGRQLRLALEHNEFALHYQPKLDLRTGQVCGAEALLRWNSPDRGLVLPGSFVPLMEETGLILDVGRWVLEHAVSQREQWLREGLAVPRISVNVSAVQLRETNFVESVQALLSGTNAAAGIELEVTESMMMADPDASVATLRTLRGLGLTIAMDDYGTGYSSLAYLNRLPLNSVKIDRSFVITMVSNPDTMNIVSSIIALAHSMNLKVVAEGVDAEDQLQYLRLLRCDEIQGFLFSQPLPAAEFAALLRSGKKLA